MLDNGYGISLDSVLMRPPHVLVNVLCLVLVELDIVLCMSTLLAEATVLLENPRSFASVVCVCVCGYRRIIMSPEEGQITTFSF